MVFAAGEAAQFPRGPSVAVGLQKVAVFTRAISRPSRGQRPSE